MRQKIAAGNWKMNTSLEEGMNLASEIINMIKDEVNNNAIVILAAPFTHLYAVGKLITTHQNISLAAQNCSSKLSGAYTGEISVGMLKSIGVKYVIIGHSERRQYFNESNEILRDKINTVIENGLIPIFCCGESLDQRENTDYVAFVCSQLTESLFHLSPELFKNIVIAYEPIWAIGTGKTASLQQAQDMHLALRNHIASKYGNNIADNISLLYGGSVSAGNAAELFAQPDVDGGLVGGASLKSRDFVTIIKAL